MNAGSRKEVLVMARSLYLRQKESHTCISMQHRTHSTHICTYAHTHTREHTHTAHTARNSTYHAEVEDRFLNPSFSYRHLL